MSSVWSPLVFHYRAFRRNTPHLPCLYVCHTILSFVYGSLDRVVDGLYGSFESICDLVRSTILVLSKRVVSMVVFFTQKKQKS
jgi:hypothetical protein